MDKVFSIKVQEINSPDSVSGDCVSLTYSFDPNDRLMEEQRGKLFAVLDISGEGVSKKDLNAGARLILDVLKETYFGELEGTPLQALEKAFHTAKEKVSNMPLSDGRVAHLLDLNLIVGVLWGKVLYIAQFGSCSAYIIRGTSPINVGKNVGGEVVVSSGIVEKGDVLVLGSSGFKELFNLENLARDISKLSDPDFLKGNKKISAIIVKFDVLNFWGSDDTIKFVAPAKSNVITAVSRIKGALLKKFVGEPKVKIPLASFEARSKKKLAVLGALAVLLTGALAVSIIVSLRKSQEVKTEEKTMSVVESLYGKLNSAKDLVGKDNVKAKALLTEISSIKPSDVADSADKEELNKVLGEAVSVLDEIEGVVPVGEARAIYDVSADGLQNVTGMVYSGNNLYVWSKNESVGVKLDVSGEKPSSSKMNFGNNPNFIDVYDNSVYALDNLGMYIYSGDSEGEKQNISGITSYENTLAFKVYYGNGYALTKENVIKIKSSIGNKYSADKWLKVPLSLDKAVDFAIDGNLYVLFSDGNVKKLYVGEEDTAFMLKDLPSPLKGPRFICTNVDMNDIYILDVLDRSIVVVDKMGEYQKKYRIKDSLDTSKVKGFVLNGSLDKVFLLIGTKVIELSL